MTSSKRQNDTQMQAMLRRDDKGISEARGILSRLLRIIMCEKDVGPLKYSALMNKWLSNPGISDMLSERGNMNKDMYRENMTWNSFLKSIVFLRAKWLKVTVEIAWKDTPGTSTHSIIVADPESFVVRKERRSPRKKSGKSKQED